MMGDGRPHDGILTLVMGAAISAVLIFLSGCGGSTIPRRANVTPAPTAAHPVSGVPTSITAFVGITAQGPFNSPAHLSSFAEFGKLLPGLDVPDPLANAVRDFFLNGGTDGIVVRAESDSGYDNAIGALDSVDQFNMLCILPHMPGQDVPSRVWQSGLQYCLKRRAILIIDPPLSWTDRNSIALGDLHLTGESTSNAALYFPRIVERQGDRSDTVAPSGAVAGVTARTDAKEGVWQSPAGSYAALLGSEGPAVQLSAADVSSLISKGINAIRKFPGKETVGWGSRTLAGTDNSTDWKYIPVRRLALYIEESVYRGTLWSVFEPDADPLWVRIRSNVGDFMHTLWQNGALQGTRPEEAYYVKCDPTTMTQADVHAGIVNILVGFAPVKPAEFIILKIQQRAAPDSSK